MGVELPVYRSLLVSIDGLFHYFDIEKGKLSQLIRARVQLGFRPVRQFTLFAGPTYNLYLGEESDGSNLAPWTDYSGTWGSTHYRFWPGFTAGIRFAP
jgi:hypothetical protein